MAESQKVEQCELPHSSSLLDDVFTEESPRTKLLSNASSSRGSMSSVSEQQDDAKRSNVLRRRYAKRSKENSFSQEVIGHLTREVHEALNIPYMSLVAKNTTYLQLLIPDHTMEETFSIQFRENLLLATIKDELILMLKDKHPGFEWDVINEYRFIYQHGEYDYQLVDDYQYMYPVLLLVDSFFYLLYQKTSTFPLIIVERKLPPTQEEEELHDKIRSLSVKRSAIGRDSGIFDSMYGDDAEVRWAKYRLKSQAIEVARSRDPVCYSMMMELDQSSITENFYKKVPANKMITVFIHVSKNLTTGKSTRAMTIERTTNVQKTLTLEKEFNITSTATEVLAEVLPCFADLIQSWMDNYVLQVTGEESYITGDIRLLDFKAVRRAIFKSEELHLSVVSKPHLNKDNSYDINWPLVDPFTGKAPSHQRLCSDSTAINPLSLWDLTFPFSFTIKKVSNVPHQLIEKDLNVSIQAGLSVGGKMITNMETTSVVNLKYETIWNHKLLFKDTNIQSIPKATRLVIIMIETGTGRPRKSSVSSKSPELYWVTTSLIDHRNLLKVGICQLHMWPMNGENSPENLTNGPIANNPDTSAVLLTIEFENFARPIIFPSGTPSEILDYANPRPDSKHYSDGITKITEAMSPRTLQYYIQKVIWSDPEQVAETYGLLQSLKEPLPLAVAFKFLDSDCPDEFVRAFAVERLRELKDDELMGYLLQLVQALKFEANHDSALARFLLERALQNKLIGHFFFWYSQCEAQTPQYTVRYDTLLEAYLVGCGKDMLKCILDQMSILSDFQRISFELNAARNQNATDNEKLLKKLLVKYNFSTKSITPLHNPVLRIGNLIPEKCKVMQSKKMPMWLSMSNIHPSAIQPVPYKLIVKSGDDLRQDMLTLQMLTLFDKIWQEDGLDLCLIPYGCLATGPNSGIIEVVKNARTVADISGITDNTKLLQWIEDQQRDRFGEKNPELFQAAINRFIRSCAGYSVATYVLGIGDRHNDNIMVTTSGNLFHIDFGHFLGHVKYFMRVKRERCPFVLTPDFIHVMGGETSATFFQFKNLCCRAFLSLRKHADLIVNLFSMMRYTGIPELTCVEDLEYLRDALMVTKDDTNAERSFEKLINKCIRLGWTVQISWWAHIAKTRNM
ncbi:phosphatidylinositol 4,5-bisphosphate 3-kinase catalytic subunit gamma isoform-like isoform X2 [Dysidea avara]|uniref:phosphatidylinositol 4,5-bisphosphate 3-kinase catalytic subunit gamma isoform-like isoform X2 n=1 Tax=Dysidea avara TaxID=196820 RepID=UPI003316BA8B